MSNADETHSVQQLKDAVAAFVAERQWQPFHNAKNLAMSIAIEAAELMEHFQWLRTDELAAVRDRQADMQQIREELADILCYALSFANALHIDLTQAVLEKLEKNRRKYPAEQYRGRFR